MSRRIFSLLLGLALVAIPAGTVQAQTATCQLVLGFKTLHDMDAADIGDCVDNQAYAASGDALQHTTKGLLVWRKADNWTAFTNGYMTWINGPQGLVSRLNTDHFPWEAVPTPAPTPSPAPASSPTAAGSGGKISYNPGTDQPVNPNGPCLKAVGVQVKHEAGDFYRIEVQAVGDNNSPIPGAYGTYTADYTDGYWPLRDVTDSTGFGWNTWQVAVHPSGPIKVTATLSSGGCVVNASTTFQVA